MMDDLVASFMSTAVMALLVFFDYGLFVKALIRIASGETAIPTGD